MTHSTISTNFPEPSDVISGTYRRPDGAAYGARECEIIERFEGDLLDGTQFARVVQSDRGADAMRSRPPMTRNMFARYVEHVGRLARRSDALAQFAQGILRAVPLYATPPQARGNIYSAAFNTLREGFDDVILRSGPEAPRASDCKRPYTVAEVCEIAVTLEVATQPMSDTAPGIGWCLQAIAMREGVRLPLPEDWQ